MVTQLDEYRDEVKAEFITFCQSAIPPESIKQLDQGGISLDYVNEYDVKVWLDEALAILGYPVGGWTQSIVSGPRKTASGKYTGSGGERFYVKMSAVVRIEIPCLGWHCEDQGTGEDVKSKIHTVDPGEAGKKAVTDGAKRCLRNLAGRFGGHLYKKDGEAPQISGSQSGTSKASARPPAPAGSSVEAAMETVVKFGKHSGKTLGELPEEYLRWIVDKGSAPDEYEEDGKKKWKPYPDITDAAALILNPSAGDQPQTDEPPLPEEPPDMGGDADDDLPF